MMGPPPPEALPSVQPLTLGTELTPKAPPTLDHGSTLWLRALAPRGLFYTWGCPSGLREGWQPGGFEQPLQGVSAVPTASGQRGSRLPRWWHSPIDYFI